jgi:hypothetical protein
VLVPYRAGRRPPVLEGGAGRDARDSYIMETLAGPVGTGINIAKGAADRAMSGEPEFQEAVHNIKEGGPVGANLGKAALAVGRGALSAIPGGEGVYQLR